MFELAISRHRSGSPPVRPSRVARGSALRSPASARAVCLGKMLAHPHLNNPSSPCSRGFRLCAVPLLVSSPLDPQRPAFIFTLPPEVAAAPALAAGAAQSDDQVSPLLALRRAPPSPTQSCSFVHVSTLVGVACVGRRRRSLRLDRTSSAPALDHLRPRPNAQSARSRPRSRYHASSVAIARTNTPNVISPPAQTRLSCTVAAAFLEVLPSSLVIPP